MDTKKVYVIDTETTGFGADDELLQVSIIDAQTEETVYDTFFKPSNKTEWAKAEAVNHISPASVQDCPSVKSELTALNEIFDKASEIIGYNVSFDLRFLRAAGVKIADDTVITDIMPSFAKIYGEWNDKYNTYKYQKLTTAADYYGYNWDSHGEAHNSLADCYATAFVYSCMAK